MTERRYPIGIQTFERIIRDGYLYIDKTDLVWQLAHYATFIFMSRPRRFGKSLLTSTLESYFKGEKQLFDGLKIMQLEKEWEPYPVFRLDLSSAKHMPTRQVIQELELILRPYESIYGSESVEMTPGMRLSDLIDRAFQQTGHQVVVIIDEYDAPLLDVIHDSQRLAEMREVMQEFYQRLKKQEAKIKFCFITGITRISQLNIFSTLNNLANVSLLPRFSAICGITETELHNQLLPDLKILAESYDCNVERIKDMVKARYDGYHFSEKSEDIFNPYSVLSAFANQKISNYWFETGTPSFLVQMMQKFRFNVTEMDGIESTDYAINRPTEAMTTLVPLLYQSGYLTIKGYDRETEIYTLGIPNQEVRIGYSDGLLPTYVGLEGEVVQAGFARKFWMALKQDDVDLAMREMQTYLAGIPYVEGFKKKLAEAATVEGFYEYTLYLIFSMLNVYVRTQVKCAGGRTDMVVWMPDTTYVFELKAKGTAKDALMQISDKGYAIPYVTEGRKVVKVGVRFDIETRTVSDWEIESDNA